jgi:acyl carrier protein
MPDIKEELKTILLEIAEDLSPEKVNYDSNFITDLSLDSMLLLEFGSEIESKYDVQIPEEEYPNMATINQTADLVNKLKGK